MEPSDDKELRAILLDRIREKGRITFEEYMRACLYEPGLGYYTSQGHKVGAEGDFYTSINVHQVFGRLVAREIVRMWETMAAPAYFDIVEAGAGLMDEIAALESHAASEEERLKNRLTLKKLILPEGGMGDVFKILIQAKGVDNSGLLCEREWCQGL